MTSISTRSPPSRSSWAATAAWVARRTGRSCWRRRSSRSGRSRSSGRRRCTGSCARGRPRWTSGHRRRRPGRSAAALRRPRGLRSRGGVPGPVGHAPVVGGRARPVGRGDREHRRAGRRAGGPGRLDRRGLRGPGARGAGHGMGHLATPAMGMDDRARVRCRCPCSRRWSPWPAAASRGIVGYGVLGAIASVAMFFYLTRPHVAAAFGRAPARRR